MRHHSPRWTVILLGLLVVAPATQSQEKEPVRIGIIYTNTGPLAQLGIDMRDGVLLYWSQVGNKVAGRRVEILAEATGSNKPDEGLSPPTRTWGSSGRGRRRSSWPCRPTPR
jgi:branched-chain amino acid transport system substrate-binding protein